MNKPLHCLIVEDSEDDALLVVRQLRGAYNVTWERVETNEAMRAALDRQLWDVVIADYKMPYFSGIAALELLKASGKDLPFILVSGTIGEDVAVAAMKAGAHDYIMKDRLTRLVPAVERELHEAEERRANQRSEAALAESELRFRNLIEQSPIAIGIWSDGAGIYGNRALAQIFGLKKVEEWVGRPVHELFAPQSQKEVIERIRRRSHGLLVPAEFESVGLRADGSQFPIHVAVAKVKLASGVANIAFISDITDRHRAEVALAKSEERFRIAAETANDAIYEWDLKQEVKWSDKIDEMLGCKPGEFPRTMDGWMASVHPDDLEHAMAGLQAQLKKHAGTRSVVYRMRRKDGIYRWWSVRNGIARTPDGKPVRLIGSITDITEQKQAEATLQESEMKYRDLVEQANCIILRWTRGGVITFLNGFGQKFFGYTEEQILGRHMVGTIISTAGKTSDRDLRRVMEHIVSDAKKFAQTTYEHMRRNGEKVWVTWSNRAVTDRQGHAKEILSIGFDITERRQTELALKQEQALFDGLANTIPDAIYVKNRQSMFIRVNKAMARLFGVKSAEELVGMTDFNFFIGEHARQAYEDEQRIMATGDLIIDKEEKETWPDGHVSWASSTKVPMRDETGNITGLVGISRDITERKRADEHIREQAALLDNANDAIYVTTFDHTILYWNRGAERTYGWTTAEAVNRKATDLLSPDPAATAELGVILLQQENWSGERSQKTKGGAQVEVFSRLTLMRDEHGQPQSVLVINTDITEKRQLEAQYLRAQRLESIGALASGIAHDLNNVLTPILLGAPLLDEMLNDKNAHHILKMMESNAQRGAGIIKQVLTFARGVEGDRVPVQPRHIISEIMSLAAETFPKGITVESDMAADLWPILGDATQLHQALLNLCVNARDAMPGGGVLTLKAANVVLTEKEAGKILGAHPGTFACLSVTDTGTGISPEVEAKIFEPFFTTKAVGKGTGLGLSTVLGIVRSHGGFVRLVSKIGHGSTFELYLPATTTAHVAVKSGSATPWPRARGETILMVDDEATICEVARQALTEFGYEVITTGRGTEAISIFEERRQEIQLVLTDMMMPEIDGPTLVAALRALDPEVRIIGITGVSDLDGMSALNTLALSAMLAKPFTIEKLLKVIRETLTKTAGNERAARPGLASP